MSDILSRYKDALERLASDAPMMKAKDSGINSSECKSRILYAKRVLKSMNRIDSIELGVIAEMESQENKAPVKGEVKVGEVNLSKQHH